jgi:hypothetical protein
MAHEPRLDDCKSTVLRESLFVTSEQQAGNKLRPDRKQAVADTQAIAGHAVDH